MLIGLAIEEDTKKSKRGCEALAISFLIWSVAPSDPIRRGWRKQQSEPPWVQRWICFPKVLSLLGANPLVAG
jgi:hypothetical protein